MEVIEQHVSPTGNLGRDIRTTQRKFDKIQGTTENLLDIAKGETKTCVFARHFNPVIRIMEATTNNCVKKLNAAAKDAKSAVEDVDKLSNRISPSVEFCP